jgi:pentose-5-phosphate-3-epimerase
MNREMLSRGRASNVTLSGSLLGVPAARRHEAAKELWSNGAWVHADVLEGSYAHQPGVSLSEIEELHRLNAPTLDVHLMVDDPAEACRRLPSGLGRITVQIAAGLSPAEIVAAARSRTESVWLAVDETYDSEVLDELIAATRGLDVAGILVMLTPPGQPGKRAGLERIEEVRRLHRNCEHQLAVDGDVNAQNFDAVVAAGATYLVSGRALLSEDNQPAVYEKLQRQTGLGAASRSMSQGITTHPCLLPRFR